MNTIIRPEQKIDITAVYELNQSAFGQDNEAHLTDMLRQGPGYIPELSLIALQDDLVVGFIMFTKVDILNGDARYETLALAPMAVHPQYQKKGIGARLITQGLQNARDLGFASVIVLGHEHYYPKFGFVPAAKWGIKVPVEVPENVFMAIELVPGSLTNISGVVEYPVAFSTI